MSFKFTFDDDVTVEVDSLELSSREMRSLRKEDEISIMYDLMEKHLPAEQLDAIELLPVPPGAAEDDGEDVPEPEERALMDVAKFFQAWLEDAVSGK